MHIYSAQMTATSGRQIEAAELVARIRDTATATTGIAMSAWAAVVGAPYGSFGLSMRVDGLQALLDATASLATSEAWAALADDTKTVFTAPAEISYDQVLAATATELGTKPIVSINRAQISRGQLKAAVGKATEMLNFIKDVTGEDGMLTLSDGGANNELAFIFGVDSAAAGDAANAALAANPDWLDMMDAAGPLFAEGSGHRMYAARMP